MWRDKPEAERRTEIKYCFTCGHSEDYHEHHYDWNKNGELVLGSCLRPVGYKNKVLGFKFIDICKCKLFITKDMVREVGYPEQ